MGQGTSASHQPSHPKAQAAPSHLRKDLRALIKDSSRVLSTVKPPQHAEASQKLSAAIKLLEEALATTEPNHSDGGDDADASWDSELRAAFNVFDRDGTGTLTAAKLEEVCRFSTKLQDHAPEVIAKALEEFDVNKDGAIDFGEFCQLVGKYGELFGLFDVSKLHQVEYLLAHHQGDNPFKAKLHEHFPGALHDVVYVDKLHTLVAQRGFDRGSCIACVSLCRDEITDGLHALIDERFANSFTMSSLAGMLTCGKTGFGAAHHHAPLVGGRERYVYVAMPHIAIDSCGNVGIVRRAGRFKDSNACGALIAFHGELTSGNVNLNPDGSDIEQCHLKARISAALGQGPTPSLVDLTKVVMGTILADLEEIIALTVNAEHADYVVAVGVQVHGPPCLDKAGRDNGNHLDFVWPGPCYVVREGVKEDLTPRFYK